MEAKKAQTSKALAKFNALRSQEQYHGAKKTAAQQEAAIDKQVKEWKEQDKAQAAKLQEEFGSIVAPVKKRELTEEEKKVVAQAFPGLMPSLEQQKKPT